MKGHECECNQGFIGDTCSMESSAVEVVDLSEYTDCVYENLRCGMGVK